MRRLLGLSLLILLISAVSASAVFSAELTQPESVIQNFLNRLSDGERLDFEQAKQLDPAHAIESQLPKNIGAIDEEIFAGDILEGTLQVMSGPDKDYYFLTNFERTYNLNYQAKIPVNLIGKTVSVTGELSGLTIFVKTINFVGPGAPEFDPIQRITAGVEQTAVLALRYSDIALEPTATATLQNLIFGSYPSVKTLWEENSYNILNLQNIGVNGWWALPNPQSYYNPSGRDPLFLELVQDTLAAANNNGVQFQNRDRLILFFNGIVGNAAGWGDVYKTYQSPYGPVILSVSWMPWPGGYTVAPNGQEYGHQLGFDHSGNVYAAYDSPWDVMSNARGVSGACTNQGQHTIVNNKINPQTNWLAGDSATTTSAASFLEAVIYPTTRTNGLRAIKITTPNPNVYFTVESRKQENHDSCLPNSGVIIHKVDNSLVDWQAKPVDATPGDNNLSNAQWNVGQMYFDPEYRFRIHLVSNEPNQGARIRVEPFPSGWSQEIQLSFNRSGSLPNPAAAIARDFHNNIHIVWASGRVYYTKFDGAGNMLINALPVTGTSSVAYGPADLAIDSSDNLHAVWGDSRSGTREVWHKKFDASGRTLVNDHQVSEAGYWGTYAPKIAIDVNDNPHIIWVDDRHNTWTYPYRYIYYSKLDSNGNTVVDDFLQSNSLASAPDIVIDSENNIHLVWAWQQGPAFNQDTIYYKKLLNNGTTTVVFRPIIGSWRLNLPRLDIDSRDNIHVVWSDERAGAATFYKKLDKNGRALIDDMRIGYGGVADLAIDARDDIHAVWDNGQLYYKKLNNNASTLIPETQITFPPGASSRQAIAVDANNIVHLVWEKWDRGADIYYKRSQPIQTLSVQGAPKLGSRITFNLSDPANYNGYYLLLLSLGTSPGIQIPGGPFLPLKPDDLFYLSLVLPGPIGLSNSLGAFNSGQATVTWDIPNIPFLAGLKVNAAFISLSPGSFWPKAVSPVVSMTLLP